MFVLSQSVCPYNVGVCLSPWVLSAFPSLSYCAGPSACLTGSWLRGPSAGLLFSSWLSMTASFPAVLRCLLLLSPAPGLCLSVSLTSSALPSVGLCISECVFSSLSTPPHSSGPKTQQLPAAPPFGFGLPPGTTPSGASSLVSTAGSCGLQSWGTRWSWGSGDTPTSQAHFCCLEGGSVK